MTDYEEYLRDSLRRASEALDAACKLLDKRFGSRRWREDWTIADTADAVRLDAFGFNTFEEAQEEAAKRRAKDGRDWGAWFSPEGHPMVMISE